MHLRTLARVLLPVAAFALVALPFAPVEAKDKEPNFIEKALEGITIGEGQMTAEVAIFPIIAAEKPEKVEVRRLTVTREDRPAK